MRASWSLLVSAIAIGRCRVAATGLLAGGAFLYLADQVLPRLHAEFTDEAALERPKVAWRRSALLMLAMTLHNPAGLAIALPLRRGGMTCGRAFFWGQRSAAIEPVAGVIGAALVLASAAFLPYAMAAAAGAMLYVVVEELIPETVRPGTVDVATLGFIFCFTIMMSLDNALAYSSPARSTRVHAKVTGDAH